MNNTLKLIIRLLIVAAVLAIAIFYEYRSHSGCAHDTHEGFDVIKEIIHWVVHLGACILVCETFHSWRHKKVCKDHKD